MTTKISLSSPGPYWQFVVLTLFTTLLITKSTVAQRNIEFFEPDFDFDYCYNNSVYKTVFSDYGFYIGPWHYYTFFSRHSKKNKLKEIKKYQFITDSGYLVWVEKLQFFRSGYVKERQAYPINKKPVKGFVEPLYYNLEEQYSYSKRHHVMHMRQLFSDSVIGSANRKITKIYDATFYFNRKKRIDSLRFVSHDDPFSIKMQFTNVYYSYRDGDLVKVVLVNKLRGDTVKIICIREKVPLMQSFAKYQPMDSLSPTLDTGDYVGVLYLQSSPPLYNYSNFSLCEYYLHKNSVLFLKQLKYRGGFTGSNRINRFLKQSSSVGSGEKFIDIYSSLTEAKSERFYFSRELMDYSRIVNPERGYFGTIYDGWNECFDFSGSNLNKRYQSDTFSTGCSTYYIIKGDKY